MLDRRAWIIACLIVLLGAGTYVLWITRARAKYEARSLSAAQRPPGLNPNIGTRVLHVEGCDKDFIVKTGELVEPRVVPGGSLDDFRALYGQETKKDKNGTLVWELYPYSFSNGALDAEKPDSAVHLSVDPGHVVETLDGVELGIDSIGTIFRKMRDLKVEVHESIEHADGNWTIRVSMYSACGHKFRSEYSRTISSTPEIDRLMAPRTTQQSSIQPTALWRSDVFMNKVVYVYTMQLSNGSDDDPAAGEPSEHD